jgi:heme exporter protein D
MSAGEFLAMGGYGFYVWGSYIVAVLAIAVEVIAVRIRLNAARRISVAEESNR